MVDNRTNLVDKDGNTSIPLDHLTGTTWSSRLSKSSLIPVVGSDDRADYDLKSEELNTALRQALLDGKQYLTYRIGVRLSATGDYDSFGLDTIFYTEDRFYWHWTDAQIGNNNNDDKTLTWTNPK